MDIKQEAELFVLQMVHFYLVERDIEKLLSGVKSDFTWIGIGEQEIREGKTQLRHALEMEFSEYDGSFTITEQSFTSMQVSDNVFVVYGSLRAVPVHDWIELQKLHISAVCHKTPYGLALAHCNISHPNSLQKEFNNYVLPQQLADNKSIRKNFKNKDNWIKNLTSYIPAGIYQCSNDEYFTLINMSDSFLDIFGLTRDEIKSKFDNKFINMVYPEDRDEIIKVVNNQLSNCSTIEIEYRVFNKTKGYVWVLDKGKLMKNENGVDCFYCVLVDITHRKSVQEELRLSLERHQIIMDQADDIIFEWDIDSDTLSFSSNWYKKFGYDPIRSEVRNKFPKSQNLHPDDIEAFLKIARNTAAGIPFSEVELRIKDLDGRYRWTRVRATSQVDQKGRAIKAVGVITDISIQKEEQLALIEQAQIDSLTGLYNKAAIRAKIENRMKDVSNDEMQAMLILDLDHFKNVNDTYGHLCGDTLLSDVAEQLKKHFRSSDLIGRIGGDEYLVFMSDVKNAVHVKSRVEAVLKAISLIRPYNGTASVTCSVGAAVLHYSEVGYLGLYQAADRALYYQKNAGRNGVSFYDPVLCDSSIADGLSKSAVNEAIDSEQCSMVEQKLAQYTFKMLYHSIDIKTAVNQLLEIVGRSYNVSRVYIFESTADGCYCNNTFEWCAEGITQEIDNLQSIHYQNDLNNYEKNFNSDGVFYCHDIDFLEEELYQILAPQGIRSILQCAILDKGKFKGFVGFDECTENCIWNKEQIRSLTFIANVLSVFLIKLRLEEQIDKQNELIGSLN